LTGYPYRFRLHSPEGEGLGEFHTIVMDWNVGDTFTTDDGRKFRILKLAELDDIDDAVFNGMWMVEPS
jgi:hypothetical protein